MVAAPPTRACAHCGDPCPDVPYTSEEQTFCCSGCQTVYALITASGLSDFYTLDAAAGSSQRRVGAGDYGWLDVDALARGYASYRDESRWRVLLELPAIHCISCVWLLERLPRLLPGVRACVVDITRRTATIDFDPRLIGLREVAEGLARIGYPPVLRSQPAGPQAVRQRGLLYRIGVAGFCFGNIMLLSFPEYLGLGADAGATFLGRNVGYLLLLLSLPVLLYAARDFFHGAYRGLRAGRLTIDFPVVLGIVALFSRSVYEIGSGSGAGYLDSLAGLIFFLLIGRWFQTYTFARLRFDRDYHDYFPVGAYRRGEDGQLQPVAVSTLVPGDRILVKPGQLIPADGTLEADAGGGIDYSFVTGEADARPAAAGAEVFAGGRATGTALPIVVGVPAAESYLLQLWRGGAGGDTEPVAPSDRLVRSFTLGIVGVAAGTLAYWYPTEPALAYRAATAVLIIACPCALALAAPFAYGTLQRLLGRVGCYLRSAAVIDRLGEVDAFAFDKTGTLIGRDEEAVLTPGGAETPAHLAVCLAMAGQSVHPRSRAIADQLRARGVGPAPGAGPVTEIPGAGLQLADGEHTYRIGSAAFCGLAGAGSDRTYATLDGRELCSLGPAPHRFRAGVTDLLRRLPRWGPVYLISGDAPPRQPIWRDHLRPDRIYFRMTPFGKQEFIAQLASDGRRVLMVGDGLNDAGALRTAHVGMAVSEQDSNFSPACDGILAAERLGQLPAVLRAARGIRWVLGASYGFALLYNLVGLTYAVTGTLSPVVAAILMPLSSVTVVALASGGSWLLYRRALDQSPD